MMNKNEIALSDALKDPKMARQLQDIIQYVETTPFSKMFPEKYENSVERFVAQKSRQLFEEQGVLPLKSVISIVLNDLDDDLSSEVLLKMTHIIIEKWEQLTAAAYADTHVEA